MRLAFDEGEEDRDRLRWGVSPTNLEVRAVEVDGSGVGDAPMRPGLLAQIPGSGPIESGDPRRTLPTPMKAAPAATPSPPGGAEAIIPPCRNARHWKKDGLGAAGRNEALPAITRFGRALWQKLRG